MRATLRKALAILDGAPAGTRGQSLVELTLTLPILLVMLLGLTEIGWYADHYLTLLDVVREAGRRGATQDPTVWPDGAEKFYQRMDCDTLPDFYNKLPYENQTTWPGPDLSAWGYRDGDESIDTYGYYDDVACTVIRNMAPLEFNDETDDIVISVFSYFVLNRGTPSAHVRIYGRYPARANECQNDDQYDPFDWNHDGLGGSANEDPGLFDSGWDNVRGYVFRGNHQNDYGASVKCLGSEYSTVDVEKMLDFEGDPDRARKIDRVRNNGVILVEIFWDHHQLFGLPWFNFGPLENAQTIHVWVFFPVTAAEPDLNF
jgi:hypothetical protein